MAGSPEILNGARVAISPHDKVRANVLRIPRVLRIAVVDCRGGAPVADAPIEEIKLDGDEVATYRGASDWDIVRNYIVPVHTSGASAGLPLVRQGFQRPTKGRRGDLRGLTRVLNALGYGSASQTRVFAEAHWRRVRGIPGPLVRSQLGGQAGALRAEGHRDMDQADPRRVQRPLSRNGQVVLGRSSLPRPG